MKVFLNILFLTHQGGLAGSTKSIAYLAKGLEERGHNVYVGCLAESVLAKMLEHSRVNIIPMHIGSKIDFRNILHINEITKKHKIDIINSQSGKDRYTSIFSKLFFSSPGKVIHTRRQTPKSTGFFLQNWFYTHYTEKIVAVSNGVKQELIKLGLPEHHIKVIHNGTPAQNYILDDPQRTADLKARYSLQPGDSVIGCVSRYKQQEQLLEAIQYINRPLKVLFVGIQEKPAYQQITHRYGNRHTIIYTGKVPHEDVLYFYNLFNVKVLPSVTEGLSQALLESMAMGVPVIATDAAGNPDLIEHGVNGYLFKEGDTRDLAKKIETLLDDPAISRKFIRQGKKTALQDFNIENTINKYEEFFKNIINAEYREVEADGTIDRARVSQSINESHA